MSYSIGIDIGGTFTDIVAVKDTGELTYTKVPSTPHNFAEGFFHGFDKILGMVGASPSDVERIIHGTTVATNAITERKGAKIGILTTKGFKDVLIIGREYRTDTYSLFYEPETPTFICERRNIMEVGERIDSKGNVLAPLNEDDVIKGVDYLVKEEGVKALAVCYLFSFVNPSHEQRTEQIIRKRYPHIRVSLSSVINPMFREYERLVITAFDAYVGPIVEEYIKSLEKGLHKRGIPAVLQVMQSRGGVTNAAMCIQKPVVTFLSGPAAGVISGIFSGKLAGRDNLITLDMGGTTNDVALVKNGKPHLSLEGQIGQYPLRQAMLDVITIGAGGGSIAWLTTAGGMNVGPQSAGSEPGPACYGRGGVKPTVTDASVVLGYVDPGYFGAGELNLKPDLAQKAINENIATPLGINTVEAAAGIHKIVNNNMADECRLISVHKGYHPKNFSLVAGGGAGPVAAGRIMQILGLKEVIVPPCPGVLAALGLLTANIEHEEVATHVAKANDIDQREIANIFTRLGEICEQKREGVGISETQLRITRSVQMRYVGQSFDLEVPFPEEIDKISEQTIKDIVKHFNEIHQSVYQHSDPDTPTEFVTFRTVYSQAPVLAPMFRKARAGSEAKPMKWRQAYFEEEKRFVKTPIFARESLAVGQILNGPAIVEQADATTIIYPNLVAEVDEWGNLIMKVG